MPRNTELSKPLAGFLRWLADQPEPALLRECPQSFRCPDVLAVAERDGLAERGKLLDDGAWLPASVLWYDGTQVTHVRLTNDGAAALAEWQMQEPDAEVGQAVTPSAARDGLTAAQRQLWDTLTAEPIRFDDAAKLLNNTSVQTIRQHVYAIRKAGLPIQTYRNVGLWRSDRPAD